VSIRSLGKEIDQNRPHRGFFNGIKLQKLTAFHFGVDVIDCGSPGVSIINESRDKGAVIHT